MTTNQDFTPVVRRNPYLIRGLAFAGGAAIMITVLALIGGRDDPPVATAATTVLADPGTTPATAAPATAPAPAPAVTQPLATAAPEDPNVLGGSAAPGEATPDTVPAAALQEWKDRCLYCEKAVEKERGKVRALQAEIARIEAEKQAIIAANTPPPPTPEEVRDRQIHENLNRVLSQGQRGSR